jgi:quinol monooxygenase YgiN
MERIVIVVYRPKKGKEEKLLQVINDHMPVLQRQGLITDRKPIVMRAKDKSIIEVFEWKSAEAIEEAHSNPEVLALWERFSEVCDYEIPVNVDEFHNLFSEFEPVV